MEEHPTKCTSIVWFITVVRLKLFCPNVTVSLPFHQCLSSAERQIVCISGHGPKNIKKP